MDVYISLYSVVPSGASWEIDSQNSFWWKSCCVLSVGLETLKIQSGTKLWINLNFSLRHFDMKGSSRGKAVGEPKHRREGIISYNWPLLEYLGRMFFFDPIDRVHCWSNSTNLENMYLLYSIHTVRNRKEAKLKPLPFLKEMHIVFGIKVYEQAVTEQHSKRHHRNT